MGDDRTRSTDIATLQRLRRAKDHIDSEYGARLPIASLAAGAGYVPAHFIHAFRAAFGEPPGRYRTRRRMERACHLLGSANLTVTEICHEVGFSSVGTFSTRFTELVGRSPTAYRRQAASQRGPAPIPGCFAHMWRAGLVAPPPGISAISEKPRDRDERYGGGSDSEGTVAR